jgi:hypothetical protein
MSSRSDWLTVVRCPLTVRGVSALLAGSLLLGCERENRRFQENPPTATPVTTALVVSALQPGPAMIEP